jgi:hypothetical protein
MQLYDITIAANTTRQLDAPGSYFYYYAGSAGGADSTITLRGVSSGLRLILKPGQAFRLPSGDVETSWILTNYANAATIIGTVLVGDGDITDNRITGNVEVVDGGKNRTLANSTFAGSIYQGPTVGQYATAQIFNPVASGKNVFVGQVSFASNTATYSSIKFSTAQASNLWANGLSKKAGGTTSVAQLRYQSSAVTDVGQLIVLGVNQTYKPTEPILIPPGYGLMVIPTTTNTDTTGIFDWYEEAI